MENKDIELICKAVCICGSRGWKDKKSIRSVIYSLHPDTIVIHGGAPGADTIAGNIAKSRGLNIEVYIPDWELYGKSAGPIRNRKMVSKSDVVFAFWDGKSKGTKNSIDTVIKLNKPVLVIK